MGYMLEAPFFTNSHRRIGLEIFTLGEAAARDFDGCLRGAAAIGYREIELIGYVGRGPSELKHLFAALELRCPSIKYPPRAWQAGQLGLDNDLDQIIDDAKILSLEYVVAMMFRVPDRLWSDPKSDSEIIETLTQAPRRMTADDWKMNADLLNETGTVLKRAGLKFAFHNTNLDFAPLSDTSGYELLLEYTDPELVSFEMDVGSLVAAGRDPFDFFTKYPRRFSLMHMKDIKSRARPNADHLENDWTELGAGIVDWQKLLEVASDSGVRHFYVEQEPPFQRSPFESIRINYDYLKSLKTKTA
jgi:sugar phosphate isomerase/epimerase